MTDALITITTGTKKSINIHDIVYNGDYGYDFLVDCVSTVIDSGRIHGIEMLGVGQQPDIALSLNSDWRVTDNTLTADTFGTNGICILMNADATTSEGFIDGNILRDANVGLEIDNVSGGGGIVVGTNVYFNLDDDAILALDFAGKFRDTNVIEWEWPGTVATGIHSRRWYPSHTSVLMYHTMSIGTGPTGANLTMELLVNGASAQTTDFRLLDAGSDHDHRNIGNWNGNTMQVVSQSDYVEMNVIQVGSSVAGADLLARVEYVEII